MNTMLREYKNDIVVELLCGLCSTKVGEHHVSSQRGWTIQNATLTNSGFVDIRCSSCESLYGSFKEMIIEVEREFGKTPQEAEDFVKTYRKRVDFDKEMLKLRNKNG